MLETHKTSYYAISIKYYISYELGHHQSQKYLCSIINEIKNECNIKRTLSSVKKEKKYHANQ